MTFRAFLVCILVVIILTPSIIVGIALSPWFFLLLFALLLVFPFVLAPRTDRSTGRTEPPDTLARLALFVTLVVSGFVLALGFLAAPGFFLLMLLVCAPLLWLAFRT